MSALFVFCLDVSLFNCLFLCQPNHMSVHSSLRLSVSSDCLKVLCVSLSMPLSAYISQYQSFLLLILYDCFSLLIVFYFESLFCLTVKWFFAFIKSSPAFSLSQAIGIIIFSNLLPTTLPKIFQTLACQVFKAFS